MRKSIMRFLAVLSSAALLLGAGMAQAGVTALGLVDKKNPDITGEIDFDSFGVYFGELSVDCPDIVAVAQLTAVQKNQVDSKKVNAEQKTDKKKNTTAPFLSIFLPATGYDSILDSTTKAKMQVQATSKGKGSMKVDVDLGKAGVNMVDLPDAADATAYADSTKKKACQGVKTDKKFKKFKATLKGTAEPLVL